MPPFRSRSMPPLGFNGSAGCDSSSASTGKGRQHSTGYHGNLNALSLEPRAPFMFSESNGKSNDFKGKGNSDYFQANGNGNGKSAGFKGTCKSEDAHGKGNGNSDDFKGRVDSEDFQGKGYSESTAVDDEEEDMVSCTESQYIEYWENQMELFQCGLIATPPPPLYEMPQ